MASRVTLWVLPFVLAASVASGEVVRVDIVSRAPVAGGRAFGPAGAYERLSGTIEFALDPADPHNSGIAGLATAARGPDGRVHFTSTIYVITPVDQSAGNGVLLFEIANRGRKGLFGNFSGGTASDDPIGAANVGDGFLLQEGYTLVWVGWEFDVTPTGVWLDAPKATLDPSKTMTVTFTGDTRTDAATFADAPSYSPRDLADPDATLTVRNTFWSAPRLIDRARWTFAPGEQAPVVRLDEGFAPGLVYSLTYHPARAVVAGTGFAAIRDAAAAFRYRTDLPVRGRSAYVFGVSQSGRFLREFVAGGFNTDERNRHAFDAIWAHVAGASMGSFNEMFAMPRNFAGFFGTRPPFVELTADRGVKIFLTNSSVEYWGFGRAAAMTHVSADGLRDATLPGNVRMYFYAGAQHGGNGPFPPERQNVQELANPTPQRTTTRALLRALHAWASRNEAPPASRYPRLADATLVPVERLKFPRLAGVADPRKVPGPALVTPAATTPLPFLVPQVDGDGNETAGIRVPDQAVPLGTVTGWNFRSVEAGNPEDVYQLRGSYIPFAKTRQDREAAGDLRRSIAERYASRESYLQRIRAAAQTLIRQRLMLSEDLGSVVAFAERHWAYATGGAVTSTR